MRVDARRLRIDYIKPSIVNRGGRPRLAGGGCSDSGGPAPACAGSGRVRCEVAGSKRTFEALERKNADLRQRLQETQMEAKNLLRLLPPRHCNGQLSAAAAL